MESTIHKIRSYYTDMGRSERRIADYILAHPYDILSMSIGQLSEACRCGEATIVRFSRRIGFSGYQGLKIGIAAEVGNTSKIGGEINATDSCFDIYRKRITDVSIALQNTETVLDKDELQKAATLIMNAGRIVIFGLGNSAAIAQDASHKFLRLGLNAQCCTDNHMQAIIASHLDRKSVAVGISHSGASADIVDALKLSKIGGASTVCVTNFGDSPIVKVSDVVLFTKSEETKHSILAMSSRIAQLAIFDAIYTYIAVNCDKSSRQAIENTEFALLNKKIK